MAQWQVIAEYIYSSYAERGICTRVNSHPVPSFLVAGDSERPFGFTVRVEEKPRVPRLKAALVNEIHK